MEKFILSTCSTLDLSYEYLVKRNISYAKFHYIKNGEIHDDDLYQSINPNEFFDSMVEGHVMKTSQINVVEYTEYFKSLLDCGKDVLHICFSSGLSGSYFSAISAAENLLKVYPDRKIRIIDSLCASSGLGLLVDKAADLRDEGMNFEDLCNWIEENKLRVHHWFFTTDLKYYIRGGRLSKLAGTFAGIIGICPLLNVSNEGKLVPRAKIISKKRVIEETVKRMEQYADNGIDYNEKVFASHSNCLELCNTLADNIEHNFRKISGGHVLINPIGTVIGSHSGPGTVALFFWGKKRIN